jgi:hypothetical protein
MAATSITLSVFSVGEGKFAASMYAALPLLLVSVIHPWGQMTFKP